MSPTNNGWQAARAVAALTATKTAWLRRPEFKSCAEACEAQRAAIPGSARPFGQSSFNRNVIANTIGFIVQGLAGIWYVRFVVASLGPNGYGLVSLAATLLAYLTLVTSSFNTSVSRHLTVALTQRNLERASLLSSTAINGMLCLLLPVGLLALLATVFLPTLIRIPPGMEVEGQLFFGLCVVSFLLAQATIPFATATFCTNRMDWRAMIDVGAQLVRVVAAWLFLAFVAARLWLVGLAMLMAAICQFAGYIRLWHRLLPQVRWRLGLMNSALFREIFTTSVWNTINTMGALLFLNIDLLVINRLLGPQEAGMYAPILLISQMLRSVAQTLGSVFTPRIVSIYASGDRDALADYSRRATRFLGVLVGLPIGVVCGLPRDLLVAWLGPAYADRWPLILLLVGHLPINLCVSPQIAVQTAADRVKVPALVTLVMGLCNLLTAVFFVRCMHWGAWGVAAAGAIVLTCKNAFFTPAYTAHILHARLRLAYCGMGVSGVTAVATACFALTIGTWLPGANLLRLTVATTVALALGSVFVLAVVLNPSERGDLMARLHLRR